MNNIQKLCWVKKFKDFVVLFDKQSEKIAKFDALVRKTKSPEFYTI